jgi:hypothetical protein
MTRITLPAAVAFSVVMALSVGAAIPTLAQTTDANPAAAKSGNGHTPGYNPLKNAYFGETHLHTTYSLDAYLGQAHNGPNEAYRFARGEPMPVPGGIAKLATPLDFAAVTDHAEFFADSYISTHPDHPKYNDEAARKIREAGKDEEAGRWVFVNVTQAANRYGKPTVLGEGRVGLDARASAWKEIQAATERYYEPGKFTTLHGFEWTSAPGGANLHRNILFRDTIVPRVPVSSLDTTEPERLWDYLAQYEKDGSTLLAIPHNSNYSMGLMFAETTLKGAPIDAAWVRRRAHFEPLVEIMQIKQASEINPAFAPSDEFAGFESFNATEDVTGKGRLNHRNNYVREALKDGLVLEAKFGVNPFKLGFVAATDTHNGTPSDVEENDWVGAHGQEDATPKKRLNGELMGWEKVIKLNPGGIAGVWAEENTREAIFDAMRRKETFATSGPRIKVRFFGGWNYANGVLQDKEWLSKGYAGGVPMGGDLTQAPAGKAPRFIVRASKDPRSGNLDRIQIVKGWADAAGNTHDKIFDVVWSNADQRKRGKDGKVPPVRNTVNVKAATYTNSVGAPELAAVWTDPEFDPKLRAVYYARVLEIPTPRWSTFDAKALGIDPPKGVPATIQERAWTSPIWYSPN